MPALLRPGATMRQRVLVQLAGIVVIATGVALTIDAELGVAPYDVVTTGMHQRLGISIGLAAVLLPIVFLGAGLALGGRVGLGTLFDVALIGPLLGGILAVLPEVHALAVRIPMYAAGFSCITVGIGLVIVPDLGAGPAEVLMLAVAGQGDPAGLGPHRDRGGPRARRLGHARPGRRRHPRLRRAHRSGPAPHAHLVRGRSGPRGHPQRHRLARSLTRLSRRRARTRG